MLAVASLKWSTYIGDSGASDAIQSAWVVPATAENGYGGNGDLLLIKYQDKTRGVFSNTLADSGFEDTLSGRTDTIAQYQVSNDGTRLYVAGTTTTAGVAVNGFDSAIGRGNVNLDRSYSPDVNYFGDSRYNPVVATEDGYFAQFNLALNQGSKPTVRGTTNYLTYVGGDGELGVAKRGGPTDPGIGNGGGPFNGRYGYWLNGRDYVNTFYVDPSQSGAEVFVAGRSKSRDGVTQTESVAVGDYASFIDSQRDFGQYAQVYDGILYSLNDRPQAGTASPQRNWSTYLSPTTPSGTETDDGDQNLSTAIWGGRVETVDFVWSANSKADGTGDKLIFMLGKVRTSNAYNAPLETRLVTMNKTKLLDTSKAPQKPASLATADDWADRKQRLLQWVQFESFTYDDPLATEGKVIANTAVRSDGTGQSGPALFLRYANSIRKIDLPRNGDVTFDQANSVTDVSGGSWGGWARTFGGGISPTAFSVAPNGERFYIACTVTGYEWPGYPKPALPNSTQYLGSKLRSGASDVAVLEFNVDAPNPNWMMLAGGDNAEQATAIAALSDGTVLVMGTTNSRPIGSIPNQGWIPTGTSPMFGNEQLAPKPGDNLLGVSNVYRGGGSDGFMVAIKTSNKVASKSEIDVGGVVNATYVPVASGTQAASTVTGTDFGKSAISSAGNERTFRIKNLGTEPLTFTAPQLIIPSWLALKTGSTLPASVAAGASADITLVVKTQTVGSYTGTVQILSNDADEETYSFAVKAAVITPPPSTFGVAAVASTVTEGNTGTTTASFTVTLTPGDPLPTYPLTVRYATQGVSATAGQDFVAIEQGTLTFNQGDTTQTVTVTVNGDSSAEPDETFKLVLSAPSQGIISSEAAEATVMIANDDGEPLPLTVGFMPATVRVTEGNSGTRMAELTVGLNQASSTDVTVQYATTNLTATAGSDYAATSGTLLIAAGTIQRTIQIPIWGDTAPEADEVFTVTLSNASTGAEITPAVATVTIANDDGASRLPAVRISKPSVIEGNGGSPKLSFVISLAKAVTTTTVLTVATVDGTAKAGTDYLAYAGTVTIPAGRSSATVTVNVIPNRTVDGNRTLSLRVSNGATLLATGVGTIRDDDRPTVVRGRQVSQFAIATAFASYTATPAATARKK
jgi:hypothetical protein